MFLYEKVANLLLTRFFHIQISKMTYQKLAAYQYNCRACPTPCDGKSKKAYHFQKDVDFSEHYENLVIRHINEFTDFSAKKLPSDLSSKTVASDFRPVPE